MRSHRPDATIAPAARLSILLLCAAVVAPPAFAQDTVSHPVEAPAAGGNPADTAASPPSQGRGETLPDTSASPPSQGRGETLPDTGRYVVGEVLVTGNEKTEAFVILREMALRPGTVITPELLEFDRERIYSLRLFNRVDVSAHPSDGRTATVVVEVDERWYIFPFPIVGLRDRDWDKVFYGAGVVHNNFRGRNEKLFASLILGFDPAAALAYRNSFLDGAGDWFLDARVSYTLVRNRSPEVEGLFGEYEERHVTAWASVGRRFGRSHAAWLSGGYRIVEVPQRSGITTISGDGRDRFPTAGAGYAYDTRDLAEYPSRGSFAGASLTRYGLPGSDVDYFRFATDLRHFAPLGGGVTLAGRVFTDHAAGGRIPPYSRVYFGYRERIRGHFDRVVEGEHRAGAVAELHAVLLPVRFIEADLLPDGFNVWRFGVTAALFADAGAAWYRDTPFSTGLLAKGYGAGIHLLLPYSAILRIEAAFDEAGRAELIVDLGAAL